MGGPINAPQGEVTHNDGALRRAKDRSSDVKIFDLDFGVQIDSVKQPIKRNSVGSGHVSHRWISAFDDHFDHCASH